MLPLLRIDESRAGAPPEPQNFIGRVRMQNLAGEAGCSGIELLAVFFDAGARTRPHVHPTDQALWFVRGSGFVAFPGEPEQEVPEGTIVVVAAGALHMHGASDAAPLCHVATRAPGRTEWAPAVPEEWQRFA